MQTIPGVRRSAAVDAAKTFAIFGTILIHASANGGFSWPVGSARWAVNLLWSSVLRCAVPVFFLCSGALLLPPEKDVTIRRVWTKYLPRIALALFFWAAAYAGWTLALNWHRTGVLEAAALWQAAEDLLLFRHKSHLYYLHIMLLLYALLPLTRLFAARADRTLLRYALGVWFLLGSVLPLARGFRPLSLVGGIPAQYPINLTWGAVGYTVLGWAISRHPPSRRTAGALYLLGLAVTFFGTWGLSLARGELYQGLLQGYAPGVCLQAAGLFAFCAARFRDRERLPWAETVSRASFCVYLVHLFFLEYLAGHGLSAGLWNPLWAVPALAAATFALSFLVWLALRRIPVVNKYLI